MSGDDHLSSLDLSRRTRLAPTMDWMSAHLIQWETYQVWYCTRSQTAGHKSLGMKGYAAAYLTRWHRADVGPVLVPQDIVLPHDV